MAVHGIGKWTANMFLIFCLGRPDVLPVEDGAVWHVFRWLYGAPLADANVREAVCSLWRPYSSTAVRYMYRALNMGIVDSEPSSAFLNQVHMARQSHRNCHSGPLFESESVEHIRIAIELEAERRSDGLRHLVGHLRRDRIAYLAVA